jgi:hypothetical protein
MIKRRHADNAPANNHCPRVRSHRVSSVTLRAGPTTYPEGRAKRGVSKDNRRRNRSCCGQSFGTRRLMAPPQDEAVEEFVKSIIARLASTLCACR